MKGRQRKKKGINREIRGTGGEGRVCQGPGTVPGLKDHPTLSVRDLLIPRSPSTTALLSVGHADTAGMPNEVREQLEGFVEFRS